MATETTFFQSGDITVTNARFVVGAQTFAMRGITSVQGVETPANYNGAIALILVGAVIAVSGFAFSIELAVFGVLLIAGGIWLCFRQKQTYAVVLRTAGGEVTAYQSQNRDHISEIIQALNDSIISHG
jgi:hypothetical protein